MIENFVNDLIVVKQDCLACPFLGKATNYIVKVYFSCNVRLNTEPSHVAQTILIHGGPEISCDKPKLTEVSFC